MRTVGFVALWWVALFWLWELYAGEMNRQTLIAAAIVASIGAAVAERLRRLRLLHFRVPMEWVRRSATVPLQIFLDFAIITGALFRPRSGEFVRKPFAAGDREIEARGARAWVTLALGFAPNAYVVDYGDGEILLHDLVRNEASEKPA